MTTLLLARHGETDWNRDSRFQGQADPPLNDRGRQQARALARRLAETRISAIYTSPLARASETAEIVAHALGVPVALVAELREIDVGSWSGLTRSDVAARFPRAYRRWLEYGPGWDDGESYEELGRRVVPALGRLAARHPSEEILVLTHGGPIRAALAYADGIPYGEARRRSSVLENCAVTKLAVENGEFRRID